MELSMINNIISLSNNMHITDNLDMIVDYDLLQIIYFWKKTPGHSLLLRP